MIATTIIQSLADNGIPIVVTLKAGGENATRDETERLERLIEQLRT